MNWLEVRLVLVIFCLLLLPGWAFLAASGLWRRFAHPCPLDCSHMFSAAFFPVLLLPRPQPCCRNMRIGTNKLILLLVLCAGANYFLSAQRLESPVRL